MRSGVVIVKRKGLGTSVGMATTYQSGIVFTVNMNEKRLKYPLDSPFYRE